VGIIIGAAFGKIVASFVADILMPPLGLVIGKVDFSNLFLNLSGKTFDTLTAAKAAGAPTLNYGVFLDACINFIIVAFAIFLLVKSVNKLKRAEKAPDPTTKPCPQCLMDVPLEAKRCGHCTSELKAA